VFADARSGISSRIAGICRLTPVEQLQAADVPVTVK